MDELTSHDKNELKRLEKEKKLEEERKTKESSENKKRIRNYIIYGLIGIFFVIVIFYLLKTSKIDKPFTSGIIHWHATVKPIICGRERFDLLPKPIGEHHLGLPLLHTHDDQLIHIEGQVYKEEDIKLSNYFKVISVELTNERFAGYKNGDKCNDKEGSLTIKINNKENKEFLNHTIRDGDIIEIVFE